MAKVLQPHEQRVVEESNELAEKINKLNSFIDTNTAFIELPSKQQQLLVKQLNAMISYYTILSTRIILF